MMNRARLPLATRLIAWLGLCSAACSAAMADDRPNIVFILSDDHAWNDYGFMGHPHLDTPHLDQLAADSLVYERGYVAAPLCRPSLASLVTGLHPHQTGIRGNDPVGLRDKNGTRASPEAIAKLRARMTKPIDDLPSFVRLLSESGYATSQTGKWWEGDPIKHGFTDAMSHGDPLRGGRHGDKGLDIGRETFKPYHDFVDKAIADEKPFFVWYGVFLPHTPHDAPERLYDKYKDIAPNESTAKYWANVEWFDETCGELLSYLDKKGIADNTVILYISDNGWVPNPTVPSRFIRSKRDPYEAGSRSPIMVRQNGKVAPRRDKRTLASAIDIAPTILKIGSVNPHPKMAGLDLRDTAALAKRDRVFIEAYEHDSDLDRLDDLDANLNARVVIDGWDKLIAWSDRDELYDLRKDKDERNDLAAKHPKRVEKLERIIDDWLESTPK